jgi:hypothetical protein
MSGEDIRDVDRMAQVFKSGDIVYASPPSRM